MIDTIVLLVNSEQFKIIQPNAFTPSADLVYKHEAIKATANATAKERKLGIYKPRLTLTRHRVIDNRSNIANKSNAKSNIALKIEFSAPHILYGNNFEELQNKDFQILAAKLHEILLDMGIKIDLDNLKQANVTAIHYAKNIALTDGSTPFHFIQKIKQAYIPKRIDSNQTNYRNAGHSFKLHCNSYEIVFYDKIYDLQQSKISKKRTVDIHSNFDIKILEKMRAKKRKFEILRIEVRLNKCSKIKQLFKKLSINTSLTFQKLFKAAIARKILLHYIQMIEQKRPALLEFQATSDEAFISMLIVQNPQLKPKQILQYFGFRKVLECMTLHELKMIMAKHHERSFARLIKEIETIKMPHANKSFEIIKKQIDRYKPLKLRRML